jgi:hypothetical protein
MGVLKHLLARRGRSGLRFSRRIFLGCADGVQQLGAPSFCSWRLLAHFGW